MFAKLLRIIIIIGPIFLTSCATKVYFDPRGADLATVTNQQLCEAYGHRTTRVAEIKAELERRKLFGTEDWSKIDSHNLSVGMPECAVFAAYPRKLASIDQGEGARNDDTAKEISFDCDDIKMPFCPVTTFEIRNGNIYAIFLQR